MRYRRAVEKLRILAEACDSVKNWPPEDPFLLEAYVFGDVLGGAEEVPWEFSPHGTAWLAERLRLDKGGFAYWWRSHLSPVPNHRISAPVRFWSQEGPDEAVLQALVDRRFDDLPRLAPSPQAQREYLAEDLAAALSHLRAVHASYWDHDWRREHRGFGRYPEHHLWEAVQGYLDLYDATESAD
jgi:hypothetical protein